MGKMRYHSLRLSGMVVSEGHGAGNTMDESNSQSMPLGLPREPYFRGLAELLPDTVFEADREGRILYVNPAAAEMTGYSREELLDGRTVLDLMPLADHALTKQRIALVLDDQPVATREMQFLRRDGTTFPARASIAPLKVNGEVVGIQGFLVELTDHQLLRSQRNRFRVVMDNTPDGVYLIEIGTQRFLEVNEAACRMLGYTRDELLTMRLQDVDQDLDSEATSRYRQKILAGEEVAGLQTTHRRKDGSAITVEVLAQLVQVDDQSFVVTAVRDLTHIRQIEQALAESEKRYRVLFDQSPNPLWEQDWRDLQQLLASRVSNAAELAERLKRDEAFLIECLASVRIVDVNRRTLELHGAATKEELHERRGEIFPRSGLAVFANVVTAMYSGDRTFQRELPLRRLDGKPLETIIFLECLPSSDGGWDRVIVSLLDVTARREAERRVRQARRQVETAQEQERRLAGELHDSIGQSLVAMNLSMEAMLANCRAKAVCGDVEDLRRTLSICRQTVQDVRGICYGLYPPTLESLGLGLALRQLVASLQGQGPAIEAVIEVPEGTRFETEVEIALFRIAQEALTNALRHSEATGVKLLLRLRDNHVALAVADNGKGFSPSMVTRGLGLSTMRHRAESAEGSFSCESRPGQTVISATIPNVHIVEHRNEDTWLGLRPPVTGAGDD